MRPLIGFIVLILVLTQTGPVAGQARASDASPRDSQVVVELGRADVRVVAGAVGQVRVSLRALPGRAGAAAPSGQLATVERAHGIVRIIGTEANRAGHPVEVVLEVPHRIAVSIRLERGDIVATGVAGHLTIRTRRGDVALDGVAGSATVDVRDGNVRARFTSLDPIFPSGFTTLNGNVELRVPSAARLNLDVRCVGCTAADVLPGESLRRTRLLGRGGDHAIIAVDGEVAGGGAALRVLAWNGEVAVRRE